MAAGPGPANSAAIGPRLCRVAGIRENKKEYDLGIV